MTGTIPEEPTWSLERRESSGQLVWRRESSNSKVRFRFDVEVLEYEKNPEEHNITYDYVAHRRSLVSNIRISNSIMVCATCVVAFAVTMFLPWYLVTVPN
ncbi:uncharacterized protein LOC129611556 isoform X2 [Condylostylus longicornis]|uniref:uncharacterized protein LOC129611556 isoform X2 n=1 Tax=Condylostylus longicornis TaxID=2530218 RepID=UPI00244DCC63|nr:uncharacterized protein LOC129611556 isoform X2 [Condylostylus longicornis]XP_055380738.1 uncharacterized protein LOC129611556 isoform X2 [Condylostylus longicornis]XP_055380747.1 uncharacterized protein LOC129611556 isoform X2 [Condylostylus longicornis]XP_055380756.1 uncharacterized protein LOC129611556 isoform X2 [Condylostylus longicornis]XP_055380764.1 uncharacterized protein LOC129611556 isoform X2 [Condylostylus longicornis]XP_055380770.1 uncharacterized protein LOC129611556 isoform 